MALFYPHYSIGQAYVSYHFALIKYGNHNISLTNTYQYLPIVP